MQRKMDQPVGILMPLGVALGLAVLAGMAARAARLSPIIGYLVAGSVMGPFTWGIVGDQRRVAELADIGIVFLMFAMGMEFSLTSLRKHARIALVAAPIQLLVTFGAGLGASMLLGWDFRGGLFGGAILAISSTMVALRVLHDRGELMAPHGKASVALLIAQDIVVVLLLTGLRFVEPQTGQDPMTVLYVTLYVVLMLVFGRHLVARLLMWLGVHGSQELFLLGSVAVALLTALLAQSLGVNFALGAFFGGLVVSESIHHHRVLASAVFLRDLFGVLFFVWVGMLIDPRFLWVNLPMVTALGIGVSLGKTVLSAASLAAAGVRGTDAVRAGAAVSQMGEFSFLLTQAGVAAGILSPTQREWVLAVAAVSILLTPPMLTLGARLCRPILGKAPIVPEPEQGLVLIAGAGRIGRRLARALRRQGVGLLLIEMDPVRAAESNERGSMTVCGDAGNELFLERLPLDAVRSVVAAVPDPATTRRLVSFMRARLPNVPIFARAFDAVELKWLQTAGVAGVAEPEREGAAALLQMVLKGCGVAEEKTAHEVAALRGEVAGAPGFNGPD